MIAEFQIYYILFIGLVAGFSYWSGYKQGEMDGVVDIVLEIMQDGQVEVDDEVGMRIKNEKK